MKSYLYTAKLYKRHKFVIIHLAGHPKCWHWLKVYLHTPKHTSDWVVLLQIFVPLLCQLILEEMLKSYTQEDCLDVTCYFNWRGANTRISQNSLWQVTITLTFIICTSFVNKFNFDTVCILVVHYIHHYMCVHTFRREKPRCSAVLLHLVYLSFGFLICKILFLVKGGRKNHANASSSQAIGFLFIL